MSQTFLPFKLEKTKETLTAYAGLSLIGEYIKALLLPKRIDTHLPQAKSAVGYCASTFAFPLLLMLLSGGRTLADMRMLKQEEGLQKLLEIEDIPSEGAYGGWLRRQGATGGLEGLELVSKELNQIALSNDSNQDFTLDLDATQIVAEKSTAQYTYKGEKGYMPMVGHLAENGLIIGDDFRSGNAAPAFENLEFIEHCERQMPEDKKIARVRADSASYQAAIINHCEDNDQMFAIGASLDVAVKAAIVAIPDEHWVSYRDREIAETVHIMNETKKAFRLIVTRKGKQCELLEEDQDESYFYHAIASNADNTQSAAKVKDWYCQRGETSENRIKELKIGLGMEYLPCDHEKANAIFFRLGVIAYNISLMFKLDVLPDSWQRYQIRTVRWRLFQIAGKVINSGRYVRLKIREAHLALFRNIRQLIWEKCVNLS